MGTSARARATGVPAAEGVPVAPRATPLDLATIGRTPVAMATWLLLVGALVVLVGSAAPSLLRNMGITEVSVVVSPLAKPVESPLAFDDDVPRSVRNLEREAVPPVDEEILQAPRTFQMHSDPSDTAPQIGTVKKGTLVFVMRDDGDWVLVMVPGAQKADSPSMGWVREESLR